MTCYLSNDRIEAELNKLKIKQMASYQPRDHKTVTVRIKTRDKLLKTAREEDLSIKKLIEIMIDNYDQLKYDGEILNIHINKNK